MTASYHYTLLYPYYANVRKRLTKSPKVYILDTGLGNFLTRQDNIESMESGGRWGDMVETMAITEMIKANSALPRKSQFYFWQTSNGAEIDLIIDAGNRLVPVEVKTSSKVAKNDIRAMIDFMALGLPHPVPYGIVLYRGQDIYHITDKVLAVPLGHL